MKKDPHLIKSIQVTERHLGSQTLPQLDRFTGRLFSGLIAVIVVGFVVTLGLAAYRYFLAP